MVVHWSRILVCSIVGFSIYCPAPFDGAAFFVLTAASMFILKMTCWGWYLPWLAKHSNFLTGGGGTSCSSRRLHLTSASLPSLGPDNTAVATQFMIKIVAQNCRLPQWPRRPWWPLPKIIAGQFSFWKIIVNVSPINENGRQIYRPGCRKPCKIHAIGR